MLTRLVHIKINLETVFTKATSNKVCSFCRWLINCTLIYLAPLHAKGQHVNNIYLQAEVDFHSVREIMSWTQKKREMSGSNPHLNTPSYLHVCVGVEVMSLLAALKKNQNHPLCHKRLSGHIEILSFTVNSVEQVVMYM